VFACVKYFFVTFPVRPTRGYLVWPETWTSSTLWGSQGCEGHQKACQRGLQVRVQEVQAPLCNSQNHACPWTHLWLLRCLQIMGWQKASLALQASRGRRQCQSPKGYQDHVPPVPAPKIQSWHVPPHEGLPWNPWLEASRASWRSEWGKNHNLLVLSNVSDLNNENNNVTNSLVVLKCKNHILLVLSNVTKWCCKTLVIILS